VVIVLAFAYYYYKEYYSWLFLFLFQADHRCPKETKLKAAGGNIMRHEANYPSCVHDDIHPCTKEDEE
jgi:hypothetical protein